jgi:hypothetical protein
VDVNGVIQMLAGQARQNMVTILDVAMPAPPISGIFQVFFFFFFSSHVLISVNEFG